MSSPYIPYGRHDISENDLEAVIEVLQSDFLTQGPRVPMFESLVAEKVGAKYGVAVNSATSALHIACLALELGPTDTLWTSPNSFVASANCGIYCGARVDFVDIDPRTYNLCPEELERKLIAAKDSNSLPKVVVPVHFAGQSCDMEKIHQLSREYGFKIIEDASHAIGARYLDSPVGNCKFSDITVFSFHPVKIITTAEGGLATTNCEEIAEKMMLYRSHGITRNRELMRSVPEGDWCYEQVDLGFNYRMTEIQAALGISQLNRLNKFIDQRHILMERYDQILSLSGLPIVLPKQAASSFSALHLYPIQVQLDQSAKTRPKIFNELRAKNIGVNVHYIPIHTQPYYRRLGFEGGEFPNAEHYYSQAISIPLYHRMSEAEQDQVIAALGEVLG